MSQGFKFGNILLGLVSAALIFTFSSCRIVKPNIFPFKLSSNNDLVPAFHLNNKMLIRIHQDSRNHAIARAYDTQEQWILAESDFPDYLLTSSGWQTGVVNNHEYVMWLGCYPHMCGSEDGALIFDTSNDSFYRIHYIEQNDGISDDNTHNTLNGRALPDKSNFINFPIGRPPETLLDLALHEMNLPSASFVEGRLCSRFYCDGGFEKPAKIIDESQQVIPSAKLPFAKMIENKPYQHARAILIQQGWKPETINTPDQVPEYPELSCGNQFCGASFKKGVRELSLSVDASEIHTILDVSESTATQ
jgi:hypothetical protein